MTYTDAQLKDIADDRFEDPRAHIAMHWLAERKAASQHQGREAVLYRLDRIQGCVRSVDYLTEMPTDEYLLKHFAITPLYEHPTGVSEGDVDSACQTYYEHGGQNKWSNLTDRWKDGYRPAMRAALESFANRGDGDE